MRYLKGILIAAVILLACIAPATAANTDAQVEFEILIDEQSQNLGRAAPIYGEVRQGVTNSYTHIPNGQTLEISLTWNRASENDLDLYITIPNGGTSLIHDDMDGKFDGKISLKTSLTSSTVNRIWGCDVIGARVSGTQPYTLIINSY
ncbi:hypothetical protein [Methanorbis rubei]|uniref:Uncharacterized protein n=1 Tax=Methanorbis rubei TaxID=3028300 RepID=A0AAE4SB37_9EURY|nr:hypothetical protein [Methanocorpusculaceae archaeon Cs1]